MFTDTDIVLLAPHEGEVRALLETEDGAEAAAYMFFGIADIALDPWKSRPRCRFISHNFRAIPGEAYVSASPTHITWTTDSFMHLLGEAVDKSLIPAIVHTHPDGKAVFSAQDDQNEAELARTSEIKGAIALISLVISGNGSIAARIWQGPNHVSAPLRVLHSGSQLSLSGISTSDEAPTFLDRQNRLFGPNITAMLQEFRCGIAGGGATGSATLSLLARLGVRNMVVFDQDKVEHTNLNRLHHARMSDAKGQIKKIDVHRRFVKELGLPVNIVAVDAWVGKPETRSALKACDVIFCCTDDHAGRFFLNRFARYYGIPVIDVGLAMQRRQDGSYDLFARVSTLVAGHPCLLCGGHIDTRRAREENYQRSNPTEYERLKKEAYVLGEGDPSPAVVSFTTEAATMAVNEWLNGLVKFRPAGMAATRVRRFHAGDDREPAMFFKDSCPICCSVNILGRGDVTPFLDVVG